MQRPERWAFDDVEVRTAQPAQSSERAVLCQLQPLRAPSAHAIAAHWPAVSVLSFAGPAWPAMLQSLERWALDVTVVDGAQRAQSSECAVLCPLQPLRAPSARCLDAQLAWCICAASIQLHQGSARLLLAVAQLG